MDSVYNICEIRSVRFGSAAWLRWLANP